MAKYEALTDAELISLIRAGDHDARDYLLVKYKTLVEFKAKTYFIAGADRDDIIQEGMIGLYKAVRDFKTERGVLFCTFAELCVTRQIITAIRAASRKKHSPLSESVPLDALPDVAPATGDPEELVIGREQKNYIGDYLVKTLSGMEFNVLSMFLAGKSYSEIAAAINRDEKSIDNALWRVRKKLERALSSEI